MVEIIKFYNACITCGCTEIKLYDDAGHEISKAGGIRALCPQCGRNTKPGVWNSYNSNEPQPEAPDTPVAA